MTKKCTLIEAANGYCTYTGGSAPSPSLSPSPSPSPASPSTPPPPAVSTPLSTNPNVLIQTGTTANTTFYATAGATAVAATDTLHAGDIIVGGSGTNTLVVATTAQNTGVLRGAQLNNIQIVNVKNTQATGEASRATADTSIVTGIQQANSYLSTGDVTFNNLLSTTAVGIIGNGVLTSGILTANYVATGVNQATSGTLNLSNVLNTQTNGVVVVGGTTPGLTSYIINSDTSGPDTITGAVALPNTVTSLTVNAGSNIYVGSITGTGLASITVTGTASIVHLGSANNAVLTLNASSLSGGVNAALGTGTTVVFTGGKGNNIVHTGAVPAGVASINGGTGGTNVLDVTAATHFATAVRSFYTNFQTVRNSATATMDLVGTSFTAVQSNAASGGFTDMSAAQAANVTALATGMTAQTYQLQQPLGTNDILNLTLKTQTSDAPYGATPTVSVGGGGATISLTIPGFEVLNVTSSCGSSTDINVIGFASAAASANLQTITLGGAYPVGLVTTGLTTTNQVVAISAATNTFVPAAGNYALTLTGTGLLAGSSVIGTPQADNIATVTTFPGTNAALFISYSTGGGNDSITSTIAAINNSGTNGFLKIDGGTGTDTLTLTDTTPTLADYNFQYLANIENIVLNGATGARSVTASTYFSAVNTSGVSITDTAASAATVASTYLMSNVTVPVTLTLTTGATTQNSSVTTGSAADTITITNVAQTTGTTTVSAGAGNDIITISAGAGAITTGSISVTGGTGADTISLTTRGQATNTTMTVVIAAGDSPTTGYDNVTGFLPGDGTNLSGIIDLPGSPAVNTYTATAVTSASLGGTTYTFAGLTVAVSNSGIVTFAGTSASSMSLLQKIAAVATVVQNTSGDTALFVDGQNSYIFNHNTGGDSLVALTGVTGITSLITTNAATNHAIFIT